MGSERGDNAVSRGAWQRWCGYLLIIVAGLLVYIPFRLVAGATNVDLSPVAGRNGFACPFAVAVWPLYIITMTGGVAAGGRLLRIPLPVRIAVVLILLGPWVDLSRHVDPVLGFDTNGRMGLTITAGPVGELNTTNISQWLVMGLFPAGVAFGELAGWLLARGASERHAESPPHSGAV